MRVLLLACLLFGGLSAAWSAPVTGKVLGPDGQPVTRAQVVLLVLHSQATLQTTTDPAGVYTFDLDTSYFKEGQGIGYVTVAADGFAVGSSGFILGGEVLTLAKAGTVQGTVIDEQGTPVAGAMVSLLHMFVTEGHMFVSIPPELLARFSATTDATGHWTLTGIPQSCNLTVYINDARFALTRTEATVSPENTDPIVLTAKPGAVLTGRILAPDGAPAADIKIYAQFSNRTSPLVGEAVTDAQGHFRINGLLPGKYTLQVDDTKKRWLDTTIADVQVHPEEDNVQPDITLQNGGLLSGNLIDDATGQVIRYSHADLVFRPKAPSTAVGNQYTVAERDGRYSFRMPAGTYLVQVYSSPDGYQRPSEAEVTVAEGDAKTLDLRFQKGFTLSGTMVDDAGNPAPMARVKLRILNGRSTVGEYIDRDETREVIADKDGHFSVMGLSPGKVIIVQELQTAEFPVWELPADIPVTIPSEPITIPVRKFATQPLSGRVMTGQGTPLAGSKVTIYMRLNIRDDSFGYLRELMTDAKGRYTLSDVPAIAQVMVRSVEKTGYAISKQGRASNKDGQFAISDVVLSSLNATISGTVVDSAGKVVPGAIVASQEGGLTLRAITDAQGAFTLKGLPEGAVHLVATTADGGGRWQGNTGVADARLTLKPAVRVKMGDVQFVTDLLTKDLQLPADQRCFDHTLLIKVIAYKDPALASTLAKQEWGEALPDAVRACLLIELAKRDIDRAATVGVEQLDLIYDPDEKFQAAVALGLAFGQKYPVLCEHCALVAKAQPLPRQDYSRLFRQAQLMQLAVVTKHADIDMLATKAVEDFKNLQGGNYLSLLFRDVAEVDPGLAEKMWATLDQRWQTEVMEAAIGVVAAKDATKALQWLAELQKNLQGAKRNPRDDTFAAVIYSLGKTDPAAALALAKQNENTFYGVQPLLAAASYQPNDVALALYNSIAEGITMDSSYSARNLAEVATQAYRLDPENGKRLLAPAVKYMQMDKKTDREPAFSYWQNFKYYTYSAGRIDPAEIRLQIEMGFAQISQSRMTNENWWMLDFPDAMAVVDIARALEMIDEIVPDQRLKHTIQYNVLISLTASDH